MKDKEKQIEEMAKDLAYRNSVVEYRCEKDCHKCNYAGFKDAKCPSYVLAKTFYNAGYRKIDKDKEVVLSREELEKIINQTKEIEKNYYKRVVIPQERKETAEKFAIEMLSWLEKDDIDGRNCVIEVARQFGVEIKE